MDRLAGDSGSPGPTDWALVSTDLERALGPAASASDVSSSLPPTRLVPARAGGRSRWPLAVLLAVLLAGGAAAAAMLAWNPPSVATPASGTGLEVPPAHHPDRSAPYPARALLAVAVPAEAARPYPVPAREPATPPVVAPKQAAIARPLLRAAAIRPVVAPVARPPVSGCTDLEGDELARCIQPRLEVADHRLVDAYAAAAAAGVSRPLLVAVRDRWVDARDGTRDDPRNTLRRYAELADDLRGMAARRRGTSVADAE